MSYPKPQKHCKNCGKPITESLLGTAIGLNKFCSPYCAVLFRSTQPVKEEPKKVEEAVRPKGLKRFIKLLTTDNPLSKGIAFAKEILDRDEDYLNFVRNVPCIVCGASGSHAHHVDTGGTGVKGSDYSAIPLCHEHHTGGNKSIHHFGVNMFESFHELNIKAIQNTLLINYLRLVKNRT